MALTDEQQAAVQRVKDALAGIPRGTRKDRPGRLKGTLVQTGALVQIRYEDTACICNAIPEEKRTAKVKEIKAGVENVLATKNRVGDERVLFGMHQADCIYEILDVLDQLPAG